MKVIKDEMTKVPIKMWLDEIEDGAVEQARNLSNLPFVYKHIALMPDCHQGYGMPIGGVMATKGVVVPNAVGVDIGCGMCAVKSPWTVDIVEKFQIEKILDKIREAIPVGFNKHQFPEDKKLMPNEFWETMVNGKIVNSDAICYKEYENARHQLGTLGGGNHFIELQKDADGFIWIMIHSGSRNLGYKVAQYYNELAKKLNKQWHSGVPVAHDLAHLPIDTSYGFNYLKEMQYCVDFALANRKLMMQRIKNIFDKEIGWKVIDLSKMINIAHNYARYENHFGENVIIHRKGATSAREGELGIIPGSQGTKSYIVKGKGNKESFESCSHGAGRVMGRKEAERTLDLETEQKILNDQGIIHSIKSVKDLDEASSAYKDISVVMENQKDLVDVVVELTPLAVIKG